MKKGSPEAKAWGKRMRAMRKREKSRKINKPVSVMSHKVRSMSKRERKHGKKGTTYHVIPDLMYVGAAAELLGPSAVNIYDGYKSGGLAGAQAGLNWSIGNQILPAVVPAAELAIAGIIVQKVARFMGLNKIGTKDVKVF